VFGFLKKVFSGSGDDDAGEETAPGHAVEYRGFVILPEPYKTRGQWQLAARITKEVEGELREHHLIRADLLSDADEAREHAVMKAKRIIDEQGDGLFG
jgi:hypothetical protein